MFPFGKTLRSFNGGSKYGHQGSERESELSENEYYTHFRGLDDDIARWKQIDPKWNQSETPYSSMGNNPVMYNDALGDTTRFANLRGEVLFTAMDGNANSTFIIKDKNLNSFINSLNENVKQSLDLNSLENKKLGEALGFNINDIRKERGVDQKSSDFEMGYFCGYNNEFSTCFGTFAVGGENKEGYQAEMGKRMGKMDRAYGNMAAYQPELKKGPDKIVVGTKTIVAKKQIESKDKNGKHVVKEIEEKKVIRTIKANR